MIYEYGGSGAVVVISLANGFTPTTYQAMLKPLVGDYRVLSVLPRALWPDEPVPDTLLLWDETVAADLQTVLNQHSLQGVIGMGHSFGAIATMLSAIKDPTLFQAVILLDPTLLESQYLWGIRIAHWLRQDHRNGIANRAARRKDTFASKDDAFVYFRGKPLFADWTDEALRVYVDDLVETDEGIKLRWPRDWEAYYFRTMYTWGWRKLPQLAKTGIPTLVIRGGSSDVITAKSAGRLRRLLPDAAYHEIEGHGHLFPQTAPQQTAAIVQQWLTERQPHQKSACP